MKIKTILKKICEKMSTALISFKILSITDFNYTILDKICFFDIPNNILIRICIFHKQTEGRTSLYKFYNQF